MRLSFTGRSQAAVTKWFLRLFRRAYTEIIQLPSSAAAENSILPNYSESEKLKAKGVKQPTYFYFSGTRAILLPPFAESSILLKGGKRKRKLEFRKISASFL